jgi:glycosyltransferase involved in cell wall biosynthesis
MPKISIVIPVYNVEKYLRECLDSVVNQTLRDIEVIGVDDGSTDRSPEILDEYAKKDSRFTVIYQKNAGPATARNTGIAVSTSEYALFVDSDDWIKPDLCEKTFAVAEQEQSDMTFFFRQRNYGINNIKEMKIIERIIKQYPTFSIENLSFDESAVFLTHWCQAWSKMWKTDFLIKNNLYFPPVNYAEDMIVHWKALTKYPRLALLPAMMYYYRENPDSLILNPKYGYGSKITETYDFLKNILCETGEYKGMWKNIFLHLKLKLCFDRYVFFSKTKFADEMLIDIKNSLGSDEREYLNSSKNLSWYVKDFYHTLDGSRLAAIKNTVNIVLLEMKRKVQRSVRNFRQKLK